MKLRINPLVRSPISLMPTSALDKAKVRALMEHVNSGIQPLQNLRTCRKVNGDFGADMKQWCIYWNKLGLDSLEVKLNDTAGKFAYGDEPTLADCVIFPQLVGAFNRFGLLKTDYPNLGRVYDNLMELQGVIDSLPENQPDYVGVKIV